MKRKVLKILIFVSISALLVFPFSASAASSGSLSFTGIFVSNTRFEEDVSNIHVLSGSYNGDTFLTYTAGITSSAEFDFLAGPTSLVPGDVFNLSGIIATPNGTSSITFSCFGIGSSAVVHLENITVNYGSGGSNKTFGLYKFDIDFTNNTDRVFSNFYNSSNVRIIVNRNSSSNNNALSIVRLQYSLNNNPSVALDNQANKINSGTQSAVDSQTNETYGYTKPNSNNTDSGLASGGNLIDSLNIHIDNFNSSLGTSVDNLLDNISEFKTFVSSIYDIIPALLQYLIVFGLIFLVLRKVVGR